MSCFGCKCNHCARNCNLEPWYVTIGEVDEVCFNCDDCVQYGSAHAKKDLWKGECKHYLKPAKLEEQEIRNRRAAMRVIEGGKKA